MPCTANDNGLEIYDGTPTGEMGLALQKDIQRISGMFSPQNVIINGDFQIFQRQTPGTDTAYNDDKYCADRHYVLTQSSSVLARRVEWNTDVGSKYHIRISQPSSSQRFGIAQIVENVNCKYFAGRKARLQARIRSNQSQNIRYAILAWTGTADSVVSDVVLSWTSSDYSAGNFFLTSNLTVVAVGSTAVTADVATSIGLEGNCPTNLNNLIYFMWTENAAAQNTYIDVSQVNLFAVHDVGLSGNVPWVPRSIDEELMKCQRYFQVNLDLDVNPVDGATLNESFFGGVNGSTQIFVDIKYPVRMRVTPSLSFKRSSNGSTAGQWGYFNGVGYTDATSTTSDGGSAQGVRLLLSGLSGLNSGTYRLTKGIFLADSEL